MCSPLMFAANENYNLDYSNGLKNGSYVFGTVATYNCSPRFGLNGDTERRVCVDNGDSTIGMFNGSEPTCQSKCHACNSL